MGLIPLITEDVIKIIKIFKKKKNKITKILNRIPNKATSIN